MDFYDRGRHANANPDGEIQPLRLDAEKKRSLNWEDRADQPMDTRTVGGGALTLIAGAVFVVAACNGVRATAGTDTLARGTWGGENAGAIVGDTIAHVHIGCTFGNFRPPVGLNQEGRFNVEGSYTLRAFPVAVGPSLPAVFAGVVNGNRLTVSVAVNDTVEKKLVSLGPVTVVLGREPRMGPCPICRRPGEMRQGL